MDMLLIIVILAVAIIMNAVDIMVNLARHQKALEMQQALEDIIQELQMQNLLIVSEMRASLEREETNERTEKASQEISHTNSFKAG